MRDKAYRLGVMNGALVMAMSSIVRPDLVLSALVLRLSGSTLLAALPPALAHLGMLMPQLFVAHLAEGMPRKKPIYAAANTTRIAVLALMAATAYGLGLRAPGVLAGLCLFGYFLYASGAGASSIAFMDIVARTIPATRRGSFMGMRGVYGGALGLVAGFFVRYMLGDGGPAFPLSYAGLFAVAAGLMVAASALFLLIDEPPAAAPRQRVSFRQHLTQGVQTLGEDGNYRRIITVRGFLGAMTVGPAVFIPFAIVGLGLPEAIAGTLLILAALFALPANFIWSHIGDHHGNRRLIRAATATSLGAALLALLSAHLPPWPVHLEMLAVRDLPTAVFVLAFVLSTAGMRGGMMGTTNYLLEVAPDERRPSYVAMMRILQTPPSLLAPVIGGAVADLVSFEAAFALAVGLGCITWVLSGRLIEPREG